VGRLKDLERYLDERRLMVTDVESRLCALQSKYESFFAEVARARETELEQLIGHATGDQAALPEWFTAELLAEQAAAETELDARVASLVAQRTELEEKAEELRRASAEAEAGMRRRNLALDRQEEALKARSAELLQRVDDYNRRIRDLGSGFGFFAHLFQMRRLQRERQALDREQVDVAAQVEALRGQWVRVSTEHAEAERESSRRWTEHATEAAAVAAKLEALEATRGRILTRSAVERVLDRRRTRFEATADGTPCPRCGMPNPSRAHFCHICAQRLTADRPDLAGSLEEVAELNHHFRRFSDGMRACQEIIGLVRGIGSGIEALGESVDDMLASEKKYPLPKLQIEVPTQARSWGENLERFRDVVARDLSLHPQDFAASVGEVTAGAFTADAIQGYFEAIGEEMSRQAGVQWK